MRSQRNPRTCRFLAAAVLTAVVGLAQAAQAGTIYWDGTGTAWNLTTNWSTNSGATTPDPAAVPGSGDDVWFNISTVNTNQTVNLNAAQAALSLTFSNAGTTLLQGGGTNRTLTLGNGITVNSGAGAVTIGSATGGQAVSVLLGGSQSWTNSASTTLTLRNTVSNASAAVYTLTITGSGNTTLSGPVINGSGTLGIAKYGAGALTLSNTNAFSGGFTLNGGTLNVNHARALGTGALTISGGTIDNASAGTLTLATNNVQYWNNDFTFAGTKDLNLGSGAVTINAARAVTVTSGTLTVGGGISGDGYTITKNGGGNLTLAGVVGTTTGGIIVNAGTLALTAAPTYTGTTTLNGGTFRLSKDYGSASSAITGAGAVVLDPSSNQILYHPSAASDYSGGTTLLGGTNGLVVYENSTGSASTGDLTSGNFGTGTITVSGNTIMRPTTANTVTIGNAVALNANLTQNYAGASDKSLTVTGPVTLGGGSDRTIENDSLALMTFSGSIVGSQNLILKSGGANGSGGITLSGTMVNNTGTITNSGTNTGTTLIGASIGGTVTGVIQNSGTSKLILSGANTYTGTTTISAGTLQLGAGGTTGTLYGGSTIADNGVLAFRRSNPITQGEDFGSVIGGTGAINVQSPSSAGVVVLNGTNTFTGNVTITSGVLKITRAAALGNGSKTVFMTGGGGELANLGLQLDGGGGNIVLPSTIGFYASSNSAAGIRNVAGANEIQGTIMITTGIANLTLGSDAGTLTVSGTVSTNNAGRTLQLNGASSGANTISGPIINGAGTIGVSKTDVGTWTLATHNTYSLGTTVTAGTLVLGHATDTLLDAGLVTVNGGTLDLGANSDTVGAVTLTSGSITGTSGMLTGSSYAVQSGTVTARLGGSGIALSKSTSGTVTLSGNNSYTGGTTVSAGTLALGHATDTLADSGIVNVSGGTLAIGANSDTVGNVTLTSGGITGTSGTLTGTFYDVQAGTISAKLGGDGVALTKSTGSTVTLAGANSYSGLTTVSAGELNVQNANAIGGSSVLVSGGRLVLNGASGNLTIPNTKSIVVNGDGGNYWGGLQSNNGTNEWQGPITVGSAGTRVGVNTGTFTVSGPIDSGLNNYGLTFRPNTGTLILTATNTYLGDTTIICGTGGVVRLAGGNDRLPTATKLLFGASNTSGVLDLNGQDQEVAGLSVASGTTNEIKATAPATLTVNTTSGSPSTFSGLISGGVALVKKGADTLTLSATNTYAGNTTIDNGTLKLGALGSFDNSPIITVGDTGSNGAILDLTAKTSPFTFGVGSTWQVETDASSSDRIVISGAAAINGSSTLSFTSGVFGAGKYVLAYAASGLDYPGFGTVLGKPSDYSLTYSGTQLDLQHKAVQAITSPTPPTLDILLGGLLPVGATLHNTAPTDSADLAVNLGSGGATNGTLGSFTGTGPVAPGSSLAVGAVFTPMAYGPGAWSLQNTDPDATVTTIATGGTVNVGWATADNNNIPGNFGTALTGHVSASSYAGLASMVNYASGTAGAGRVGSEAKLLWGAATSDPLVSMQWRTQTQTERTVARLLSDVVKLDGITPGNSFVLQMDYAPSLLPGGAGDEASWAALGKIFLGKLEGTSWVNAGLGDTPTFLGPWSSAYESIGQWGVDTATHTAWAVLDSNGTFAVVPEPGTLVPLACGLAALLVWRRRR